MDTSQLAYAKTIAPWVAAAVPAAEMKQKHSMLVDVSTAG
jgi:hypothetical protein